MAIGHQLSVLCQRFQRFPLKHRLVAVDILEYARFADHISGVDQRTVAFRFFPETSHPAALVRPDHPEPGSHVHRGHRQKFSMGFMKPHGVRYVHVADPVAVGQKKGLFPDIFPDPLDSPPGHRIDPRFRQRHFPRLRIAVAVSIFVRFQVNGDVRLIQIIIGKKILDDAALIPQTDDEIMEPVMGIFLHDVTENGFSADLDHRLGPQMGFFADAGSESARKNDCFHKLIPFPPDFFHSIIYCRSSRKNTCPSLFALLSDLPVATLFLVPCGLPALFPFFLKKIFFRIGSLTLTIVLFVFTDQILALPKLIVPKNEESRKRNCGKNTP